VRHAPAGAAVGPAAAPSHSARSPQPPPPLPPSDEERAKIFLQFSKAAYCDEAGIADWSCAPCQADPTFNATVFTDAKTKGQALVGLSQQGPAIVVAFRGSSNLLNWISDLDFPKHTEYPKCDGCKVHDGFYKAWVALLPGVRAEVLRLHAAAPAAQLFFTGHSLGAALAVLAAAELHYSEGLEVDAVYTYGEPRVGNDAFHKFYSNGTHVSWRVTHNRDPVPKLPPKLFGFEHIPTEVHYNEDSSSFKICDGSGEDEGCSDGELSYRVGDHTQYLATSTNCN
jgi:hypothetical protein